jgi:uncharacterized Zn finger protein
MPPQISIHEIEALVEPKVFARGEDYFHDGMVLRVVVRGSELFAEVQGSDDEPYHVRIALSDDGIGDTTCTCPYDWGDVCKHTVAALLAYLQEPDMIETGTPLDDLLVDLSAPQLRAIVRRLVTAQPDLIDVVEAAVRG